MLAWSHHPGSNKVAKLITGRLIMKIKYKVDKTMLSEKRYDEVFFIDPKIS